MMGGGAVPNLKTLDPQERVRTITHCGDTYKVSTADGKVRDFWERNLRFKTDVSDEGLQKGAPAPRQSRDDGRPRRRDLRRTRRSAGSLHNVETLG